MQIALPMMIVSTKCTLPPFLSARNVLWFFLSLYFGGMLNFRCSSSERQMAAVGLAGCYWTRPQMI